MSPTSYRAAPPRGVQRNIPDPEAAVNTTTPWRRLSAKQGHRLARLLARDGGVARVAGRGRLAHALGGLLALLRHLGRCLLAARRLHVLVARRLDVLVPRRLHILVVTRRLHIVVPRRLHVLVARRLDVLVPRALDILAPRGLHVLIIPRGLDILAARGLHTLTARRLGVLVTRGLNVLAAGARLRIRIRSQGRLG